MKAIERALEWAPLQRRFDAEGREIPRWWGITRAGEPIKWAPRPRGVNPDQGDRNTPWYQAESHRHVDGGVHVFGTLAEAMDAFLEECEGRSPLPIK